MRATSACLFAIAMMGGGAACDELADDSKPGRSFGRLQGRLIGEIPDGVNLELAIVWRGEATEDDPTCVPIARNQPIVQAVSWSVIDETHFRIELDGPPPADAVHGGLGDGGDQAGGGTLPAERGDGVLVAYDDRDADGQLDLCRDATCTDRVLGASNPGAPFIEPAGSPVANVPGGWGGIEAAYPDSPMSLLYVEDAWKPYGVRELAAGYAVWRADADVGEGERFLDAFDPAIDFEVRLTDSPILDQLSCEGGCEVDFEYGSSDCPDLETTWCTFDRERAPDGGALIEVRFTASMDACTPVWYRIAYAGCTRRIEQWNGCPDADACMPDTGVYDSDPDSWDWSCLE